MKEIVVIIGCSFFAGITILLGGLIGNFIETHSNKKIETYILHWTGAFGGGILIAAVAFVLTPKGINIFSVQCFTLVFLSGAVVFFVLERFIEKKGGFLSQVMVMLMDFIPEAIALGAVFVLDHHLGVLLAFFIGFQNLPESYNAYFELRKNNQTGKNILTSFLMLSFLGVIASLAGRCFLLNKPDFTAGIMLFSSGGILYLIFQDIAPQSKIKNHWEPALGACLGFLVGMIGTKLFG